MKKVLSLITIFFILFANKAFAISYRDDIKLDLNPSVENTSNNINGARLIEKYLKKLKTEIETFNEKYDINGDSEINNFLKKIERMILALRKIQTISVEKNTAEEVMRSIIDELKTLNPRVKSYLKLKKSLVEIETMKSKNKYVDLSKRLSKSLSIFTIELSLKMKQGNQENKDLIIEHIKKLESENKRLINFNSLSFNSSNDVKNSFIAILKNIRNEVREIKKLID
ncbi:hypothetical protein EOM39_00655 [Candidatus Gracilibacteria bacterium]|nr:hypothetical protein [Candidatus Gracilibacteria bacterium]